MTAGEHHTHSVVPFADLRHGILVHQLRLLRDLHSLWGMGPDARAGAVAGLSPNLGGGPTPLTGRKSEALSPMGSFRVAGMTAGSPLGADAEVMAGGRGGASS